MNAVGIQASHSDGDVMMDIGGHFARRTGAVPVIVSHCFLRLGTDADVERCRKALIEFDRVLRRRPDSDVRYEWANVKLSNRRLSMDIYWYNSDFFERRKAAYRVGAHPLAFQRFGAGVDEFEIEHVRA